MTVVWLAEEIVRAVRGESLHEQSWTAYGVATDSTKVQSGDLFVALEPTSDVSRAFASGAVAAIVQHPPAHVAPDAPVIYVEDAFIALQDLSRVNRQRSQAKIVAVVGASARQSGKDLLRLILESVSDTYTEDAILHSARQAPLALARLPAQVRYGLFEAEVRGVGEIEPLSRELKPHVAIVTDIGALPPFGFFDPFAKAAAEIFTGMNASGMAVLNRDNAHFANLVAAARTQGLRHVLSFSAEEKADARLLDYKPCDAGGEVNATVFGKKIRYRLSLRGPEAARSSLAALLASAALGIDVRVAAEALVAWRPSPQRALEALQALEALHTLDDALDPPQKLAS